MLYFYFLYFLFFFLFFTWLFLFFYLIDILFLFQKKCGNFLKNLHIILFFIEQNNLIICICEWQKYVNPCFQTLWEIGGFPHGNCSQYFYWIKLRTLPWPFQNITFTFTLLWPFFFVGRLVCTDSLSHCISNKEILTYSRGWWCHNITLSTSLHHVALSLKHARPKTSGLDERLLLSVKSFRVENLS